MYAKFSNLVIYFVRLIVKYKSGLLENLEFTKNNLQ